MSRFALIARRIALFALLAIPALIPAGCKPFVPGKSYRCRTPKNKVTQKIIGGKPGTNRHTVVVDNGCSGSLIHPRVVATAGHCVCNPHPLGDAGAGATVIDGKNCYKNMSVTFNGEQVPGKVFPSPNLYMLFPDGVYIDLGRSYADLALITMDREFNPASNWETLEVTNMAPMVGQSVSGAGYGLEAFNGGKYGIMNEGTNMLISVYANWLSVSIANGFINWLGDSGGPVWIILNGRKYLVGVISSGNGTTRGNFTNVYTERTWINSIIATLPPAPAKPDLYVTTDLGAPPDAGSAQDSAIAPDLSVGQSDSSHTPDAGTAPYVGQSGRNLPPEMRTKPGLEVESDAGDNGGDENDEELPECPPELYTE